VIKLNKYSFECFHEECWRRFFDESVMLRVEEMEKEDENKRNANLK